MLAVCVGQLGQEESYEDSDQTPLEGREANILRHQWGGGWRPTVIQPCTHSTQVSVTLNLCFSTYSTYLVKVLKEAVLRIHDILVRIWILGSAPLTDSNGSGCGRPKNMRIRIRIRNSGTFTSFVKDKKSQTVEIKFLLTILLDDDGRIRSRIRTCNQRFRMRNREALKHTDP